MFASNQLQFEAYTESQWIKAGHDKLKVALCPRAAIISSPHHGWHATIPTSGFKLSDAQSDYRDMNEDLADLQLMLSRCIYPTFSQLQTILWGWWHSLTPATSRTGTFSFLRFN